MNTVTTTTLRNNLAATLAAVNENKDYLLIATRGKIASALINIDFLEDLLTLHNKEYLASIQKARQEYKQNKVFTHEQLFGEL